MNRKNNDNDRDKDDRGSEPLIPKFVPNWTQHIRFDRILINVSGSTPLTQIVSMKLSPKWPSSSKSKSKPTRITRSGTSGGPTGTSPLKSS